MAKAKSRYGVAIILILIAFGVGLALGTRYYKVPQLEPMLQTITPVNAYGVDNSGFVVSNITLDGVTVGLSNKCYGISFDVTNDQAYAINQALLNQPSARPLTADLLRDVLDNFNITVRSIRIERFGNEIYYARMFLQQGANVLDIDMRPSDAIALALRTKNDLLINETMLKEQGENICTA